MAIVRVGPSTSGIELLPDKTERRVQSPDQLVAEAIPGNTVREVLECVCDRHADLRPILFSVAGELRPFRTVFLNDEDIRDLQGLKTSVTENDNIFVYPAPPGADRQGR
jgi:molybdopterin synthase sulfur carrier subunit